MAPEAPKHSSAPDTDTVRYGVPRLYIRELVMKNFKSYAGEQRVGPFHKSFSAVVGPNGSGKSNVIDAMLFVFGKQAKQVGRLESLNAKRSGVVQMVKLAEKERDSLEDVKNEAETYMLKELSLLQWQEKGTSLAYEDTIVKMAKQEETVLSLEKSLKDEREKIQENNVALREIEAVHESHLKKHEDLDKELRDCKEKFKEFERQDVKYREDLRHMKQKIKKIEDKVVKDSSKTTELAKECENSANMIPKLEENVPKLQRVLLDEEKLLEEIKEKSKVETKAYRSELAKVRAELEPWEKELIMHRGKLDVASSESKLLSEKHEASRKAFTDACKEKENIVELTEIKTTAISTMQGDLDRKKLEVLEARRVEEKEQEALVPLEQAAREKVAELKAAMDSEKSQGAVLKAIIRAKESNQIDGIYGRMGDLGAIDAKYDIAISTACPGLDYIVVETTAAAQACVELQRGKILGLQHL